jgi:hypothetical protein
MNVYCFDWLQYIKDYPDIKENGINTEQNVVNHYIHFGRQENRIIKFNTLNMTGAKHTMYRFGNLLFFTYIIDYLARINDLPISYEKFSEISSLGVPLYTDGKTIYDKTCTLTDSNIDNILTNPKLNQNIFVTGYFQTQSCAKYIKNKINEHRENVMNLNPFSYNNNNVFIHVRLGDIQNDNRSCPFEYYDKVLQTINYDKGYISSDTITHPTCQLLINKYNLNIFNQGEVETIKFGSSCKHIILSSGTFSWYIGVFSFESNVYFPEIKKIWHGDIFVFPEWNKINF